MSQQPGFAYESLNALKREVSRRGLGLPTSEDLSVLAEPVSVGRFVAPNRLVAQPMEGCDGTPDGKPGELTFRKYVRFAAGGCGLIWCEACAVVPEGRANPRQLWLHEGSADSFRDLVTAMRQAAREALGREPVLALQLTHSGRYCRPADRPAPIIAHHNPVLDPQHGLPGDYPLISDGELDSLQPRFAEAAVLAADVGFDAVGIKGCHRYLFSELLASHTRENSRYGGSYENRTRMLRETTAAALEAVRGRIEVLTRINVYDGIRYPYGWGMVRSGDLKPELSEPIRLVGDLKALGVPLINITAGNPYSNPYVNRPADRLVAGAPDPPEEPLEGVARIIGLASRVQQAHPDLPIVGSGYSWLREYFPYVAAGVISSGGAGLVGLGRGVLAYPDFARDLLENGSMDPGKVCITCSACSQIMRDGGCSGCVVRDAEVYAPIYRAGRSRASKRKE